MKGFVTISGIVDAAGKTVSTQQAVDYGWIKDRGIKRPNGWGIPREEVPLGYNLFVDSGRQLLAYLFGYRTPVSDNVCANFGLGTGLRAPNTMDTDLESPIAFYNSAPLKPINAVDFPAAFVAQVEYTIAPSEANGYLITEQGLYSGNGTLLARKTHGAGINKTSDFGPTLHWRIRF